METYPAELGDFLLLHGSNDKIWILLKVFHDSLAEFQFDRKLEFVTFDDIVNYLTASQEVVMVFCVVCWVGVGRWRLSVIPPFDGCCATDEQT